jgi:hypothetical protein
VLERDHQMLPARLPPRAILNSCFVRELERRDRHLHRSTPLEWVEHGVGQRADAEAHGIGSPAGRSRAPASDARRPRLASRSNVLSATATTFPAESARQRVLVAPHQLGQGGIGIAPCRIVVARGWWQRIIVVRQRAEQETERHARSSPGGRSSPGPSTITT